jgi:hypothetical protein
MFKHVYTDAALSNEDEHQFRHAVKNKESNANKKNV